MSRLMGRRVRPKGHYRNLPAVPTGAARGLSTEDIFVPPLFFLNREKRGKIGINTPRVTGRICITLRLTERWRRAQRDCAAATHGQTPAGFVPMECLFAGHTDNENPHW